MRCYICDFCPDTETKIKNHKMRFDKKARDFLCSKCDASISSTVVSYEDMISDEGDLMDYAQELGLPDLKVWNNDYN